MRLSKLLYFYPGGCKRCGHTYVIWGEKRKVLIDLCGQKGLSRLAEEMELDDLDVEKLNEIWLTHVHPDHATVSTLAKKLECPVRCHPEGVQILISSSPWEVLLEEQVKRAICYRREVFGYWPVFVIKLVLKMSYAGWRASLKRSQIRVFEHREVIEFSEGEEVEVLFSPGHTDHCLAFWLKNEKILITGDLVRTDKKIELPSVNSFGSDLNQALSSITRFYWMAKARLVDTLLPGHGSPVLKDRGRILELLGTAIKTCKRLKKRAKGFFEKHDQFTLKELLSEIEDLIPDDVPRRERLILAFILAHSLGKINPSS